MEEKDEPVQAPSETQEAASTQRPSADEGKAPSSGQTASEGSDSGVGTAGTGAASADGDSKTAGEVPPSETEGKGETKGDAAGKATAEEPGITVKLKDAQVNNLNVFATLNTKEKRPADTDKLILNPLGPELLRKVEAVFVPPSRYIEGSRRASQNDEQRVFIVFGEEHSGKFTCAVRLGLDLWGEAREGKAPFKIYKRTIRDVRPLVDFVQDSTVDLGTIYIVEDAFEKGIDFSDLSPDCLSRINSVFKEKDIYLILTTTLDSDQLLPLEVVQIDAGNPDISKVFDSHLESYARGGESVAVSTELVAKAHSLRDEIGLYLRWPMQVNLFFRGLSKLEPGAGTDELKQVAEEVGRLDQKKSRDWFRDLSPNARLYAMLANLFSSLDRLSLNDIYSLSVQELREKGVSILCDPREIGLDDILEQIRAYETEEGTVDLTSEFLDLEVAGQIANHHHLLWSLIPLLVGLIKEFKASYYWEFRRDLGAAIGLLGVYHMGKLREVLDTLAINENGGVVAVTGYALDEICRSSPMHISFATELLDEWVSSQDPHRMWAAGVAIWRIYDGLARFAREKTNESQDAQRAGKALVKVREILTQLARDYDCFNPHAHGEAIVMAMEQAREESGATGTPAIELIALDLCIEQLNNWAIRNARSALKAVCEIAPFYPADMVELIATWLRDEKDENLHSLGKFVSYQLFEETPALKADLLMDRHEPLLGLVGPLLATDMGVVDTAMRALLEWLKRPEWAHRVHSALLHLANRVKGQEAVMLRESLTRVWLDADDSSQEARRIGQAVLTRSYAMEGILVAMPGQSCGMIIVDTSQKARMNRLGARSACRLFERLNPQVDVLVMRMGEARSIAGSGQLAHSKDLQAAHDLPRLLMPHLDTLDASKTCFALALAWGPVTDISDADSSPWRERLILAIPQQLPDSPLDPKTILIERDMPETSLHEIERVVRKRICREVARLEPEKWESLLKTRLQIELDDLSSVTARLSACIEQLDDIKHSDPWNDLGRSVSCACIWLAKKDLPRCVALLRSWLEEGSELHKLMGAACGRALFRLYAHIDPPPPILSHQVVLSLAPLLAHHGWESAEAVFGAARSLAMQPDWAKRLASCSEDGLCELVQLVDAVLPDHYDELSGVLDKWITKREDWSPPEFVVSLVDQLQLRMALKARKPFPDLPEGHSYGLIVADLSSIHDETNRKIAELVCVVMERLKESDTSTLQLLAFRMGEDYPAVGPGQLTDSVEKSVELLMGSGPFHRPRLVGPLLEKFSIEQVSFVLLLSEGSILDEQDWTESAWSERFEFFPDSKRRDTNLPSSMLFRQLKVDAEEPAIVERLKARRW